MSLRSVRWSYLRRSFSRVSLRSAGWSYLWRSFSRVSLRLYGLVLPEKVLH